MSDKDLREKGYQGLTGQTRYRSSLHGNVNTPYEQPTVAEIMSPAPYDHDEWRRREAERARESANRIDTAYADDPRRHPVD